VIERVEVRRGTYYDSVSLMMLSRDAGALDGVFDVAALVATPINLDLLARQGYQLPGDPPGLNDLVVAVRARDEHALDAVDDLVDGWSTRRDGDRDVAHGANDRFHNVRSLARREPDVNLLVVSVPGRYAAYEVAAGLEAGMHVFCFSSGISTTDEHTLKELAARKGLLLLGPDCGTAILDGVGVGFANAVERGPVGIVGASGTGIQEVSCLLDSAGVGISQAIGVGARDLSVEIGGTMTDRALDILFDDPGTQTIVVLTKPIGPVAASSLLSRANEGPKPVVLGLLGADPDPAGRGGTTVHVVGSLEAAASAAAALHDRTLPDDDVAAPGFTPGFVRGLFCGGTLCHEAAGAAAKALGGVWSNIAIPGGAMVPDLWESVEHTFLDLGDEALTQGRLHPMIDPTLRNGRALREGLDPSVGVLLMDVVLGFGAHPDPAEALAPLVTELLDARAGSLSVVVSLCGTDLDLQDAGDQRQRLEAAGATVTRSAASAARIAVAASGAGSSNGEPGAVR
jgi:FdrA protein